MELLVGLFEVHTVDEWNELDNAASANIPKHRMEEFLRYKKSLKDDGHQWKNDAYDILTGFIWDESEEPNTE